MNWDSFSADVIFLGAGFSRAATGGVAPLMADFFEKLDDREFWSLAKFLSECFGNPKTANVEEALLRLDQLAASPFTNTVDAFITECRKRHREVRAELDRYLISRLNNLKIPHSWAEKFLFFCSPETTVITTNYDNVAERILSSRANLVHHSPGTNCHHCRMCQILQAGCQCDVESSPPVRPNWKGSLLKLHGSIAWRTCHGSECSQSGCLIPDRHCMPFGDEPCPCCGGKCSPALVLPSMVKSFERLPEIHRMWDAAFHALQHARKVILFGFSLPRSDALISEMFRSAMGRSRTLEGIAVVDIAPKAPTARLREVLPHASKVCIQEFPIPTDGSVPSWYEEWVRNIAAAMRTADKAHSAVK